jgi:hypothetical protein
MIKLTHDGDNVVVDFEGKVDDVITQLASLLSFTLYDLSEKTTTDPHLFTHQFLTQYKKVSNALIKKIEKYKEKNEPAN